MKTFWKAIGLVIACVSSCIIGGIFGAYLMVTDDDYLRRVRYIIGKPIEPKEEKPKSFYSKNQIGFR